MSPNKFVELLRTILANIKVKLMSILGVLLIPKMCCVMSAFRRSYKQYCDAPTNNIGEADIKLNVQFHLLDIYFAGFIEPLLQAILVWPG